MFSYLLGNKLKFNLDNSSNNSINLVKNSEENNSITNNKIKFGPHISTKMNNIFLENKLNNNNILENIKKNLDNNTNINVNSHKDIKISNIHKTKKAQCSAISALSINIIQIQFSPFFSLYS